MEVQEKEEQMEKEGRKAMADQEEFRETMVLVVGMDKMVIMGLMESMVKPSRISVISRIPMIRRCHLIP